MSEVGNDNFKLREYNYYYNTGSKGKGKSSSLTQATSIASFKPFIGICCNNNCIYLNINYIYTS